ncbi:FAD-dependent oxidoreductase [Bizionia argentinensis JUB59]|uniref:FAD-dependent oxidoreductase n=1 Tax=Bizionia argentinensis JUB59 TaxID=1046627 RepID=G2E931_9FLAO|nr:NAD(P)/FAD-dependent oxidoreductase [Bizionia argentinensis]EGV45001.1 FAD-dependent oxidoreductase [Bizionia argentinensis JUB59]
MVIIIGAGLSGLLTAYRLKKEGIPFKILEARNRVGGRINTVYGTNNTPVEMGATWFQSPHKNLLALLDELSIEYFTQYMDGSVFYQPTASAPVQLVQIPSQSPSYRISGGTSNLISTLYKQLDETDVLLNQRVKEIKFRKNGVQLVAEKIFDCDSVVLAIPPKLWSKKILFMPELPLNLMETAQQTHTWMEDSIKVAMTFNIPFWKHENLSGALFSNAGPITELYDHCNHENSKFALCGFISASLKDLSFEERRSRVINQLINAYGEKAGNFLDYEDCVWGQEENTFEASDKFIFPHQNNGNPIFSKSFYDNKMFISSAESALEFPGYMDGAVFSGNETAKKIAAKYK